MHTMIGTIIIELQLQVHWYSLNLNKVALRTVKSSGPLLCVDHVYSDYAITLYKTSKTVLINPLILNIFWLILCQNFIPWHCSYQYVRKRENVKLHAYTAVQMCKQAVKSSALQLSSIPRTSLVPRPRRRGKSGLVPIARACVKISVTFSVKLSV